MGLRGVIAFLLFVAIGLTFNAYMFSFLSEHETGQRLFGKMIADKVEQEISAEKFNSMQRDVRKDCINREFVYLNSTKEPLKVDCAKVDKMPFKDVLGSAAYDQIFYKKYDCGFIGCFGKSENIPALIAEQIHPKYMVYYWYLLAIDVILAVLLFFVSDSWMQRAKSFGYVLLISGLIAPISFVTTKIFGMEMDFMKKTLYVQLAMFIAGVILLVIAMIAKSKSKNKEEYEEDDKSNS